MKFKKLLFALYLAMGANEIPTVRGALDSVEYYTEYVKIPETNYTPVKSFYSRFGSTSGGFSPKSFNEADAKKRSKSSSPKSRTLTYFSDKSSSESYDLFKISASGADVGVEPKVEFLAKQRAGSLSSRDWLELPRNEFSMKNLFQSRTDAQIKTFEKEKDDDIKA
jgi:hypothetical protein